MLLVCETFVFCLTKLLKISNKLGAHSKVTSVFRRSDFGHIGSIQFELWGLKTAGIASYFEDFKFEDRAKMA